MILMISGFSTSFLIEKKTKSIFSHCHFAIFILWSSLRAKGDVAQAKLPPIRHIIIFPLHSLYHSHTQKHSPQSLKLKPHFQDPPHPIKPKQNKKPIKKKKQNMLHLPQAKFSAFHLARQGVVQWRRFESSQMMSTSVLCRANATAPFAPSQQTGKQQTL